MKPTILTALILGVTSSAATVAAAQTPLSCSTPVGCKQENAKLIQSCCKPGGDLAPCCSVAPRDVALGAASDPEGEADVTATETKLVSLDDSLDGLISEFNAARDKPRIVALLSPTCGGCLHAARALEQEALRAFPEADFTLFVVWEPMLASDDRNAARESAAILNDPRAVQFWDEDRRSGLAYSRDVYPTYIGDIARSLPKDHMLARHFRDREDVPGERAPMWDFAAFYRPGVEWKDAPPLAKSFIRQLAIFKQPDGTTSATLYTDDFTKGPVESDWFDEVRSQMPKLLRKTNTQASTRSAL